MQQTYQTRTNDAPGAPELAITDGDISINVHRCALFGSMCLNRLEVTQCKIIYDREVVDWLLLTPAIIVLDIFELFYQKKEHFVSIS